MKTGNQLLTPLKGNFNTLEQSGTGTKHNKPKKTEIALHGKGSDVSKIEQLERRGKTKLITQTLVLGLVDVATRKIKPQQVKSYWNTFHCQNRIVSSGNTIYGNYCKARFCTLCNGIRKAKLIKTYLPMVSQWPEPYFVTLTSKAVPAIRLKDRIRRMYLSFQKIIDRNKRRHQRGKGIQLIGLKSVESNFNPISRTYNPHFHLIVASKEIAELFVNEWLKNCTFSHAISRCQDMRPITDKSKDMVELIKYGTKVITEPEKWKNVKCTPYIYLSAMDEIITAFKGRRTFDRFGFQLPKKSKVKKPEPTLTDEYEQWEYNLKTGDWVDEETGTLLTGYTLPENLKTILENNINTQLH